MSGFVYKVCAIYDSETTNIGKGGACRAFPVLFQINDVRDIDIADYEAGVSDDIRTYRSRDELIAYFKELVAWGLDNGVVPIVTAYNAPFDFTCLRDWLSDTFDLVVPLARSTTAFYTLDCYTGAQPVLRLWDCMHLQGGGVHTMGEICGVEKATGDWDYTLVRTPETPLTDSELFYARRDVQTIPAFLAYLVRTNGWLVSSMLGSKVLTSTGLVRQYASHTIGVLPVCRAGETLDSVREDMEREVSEHVKKKDRAHKLTLRQQFLRFYARKEKPTSYDSYAVRRACFRGGLSFTAASTACTVQEHVRSLDVTSMHHTFFPQDVPMDFKAFDMDNMPLWADSIVGFILSTPPEMVMKRYKRPFKWAMHALVRFDNIRLKKGSVFERAGIGLLAEAKFLNRNGEMAHSDASAKVQADSLQAHGYADTCGMGSVFAFSKLMSAPYIEVWVSEIELWNIGQVYDFDAFHVVRGEWSDSWVRCPAYVALQSMSLYRLKNDVKQVKKQYREGTPFTGVIPSSIPDGIRSELEDGSLTAGALEGYYMTVKGKFNGIYGTQAMDEYKCGYKWVAGLITVDEDTVCKPETWEERQPSYNTVLYTYGLRIVGRSRMHLVLAMVLLDDVFGERIRITGGDTDSMKVVFPVETGEADIMLALAPLHDAADLIIEAGYARLRAQYPDIAADMRGVGHFEVEQCGANPDGTPAYEYPKHIELWVKCRVSVDVSNVFHVTCAGLSQMADKYDICSWYRDAAAARGVEWALTHGIWYNTTISSEMSGSVQRVVPEVGSVFDDTVTDYTGVARRVTVPACQGLYEASRLLGNIDTMVNGENVRYMLSEYGRTVLHGYTALTAHDWD